MYFQKILVEIQIYKIQVQSRVCKLEFEIVEDRSINRKEVISEAIEGNLPNIIIHYAIGTDVSDSFFKGH